MIKNYSLVLIAFLCFVGMGFGQTQIYSLDFESPGVYTTSIPEFTDTGSDYFIRTDGGNITGELFSNIQGSFYFGAQDIDGEGAGLPVKLSIDDINISGYSNLEFRVYLAEDDDGTNQDWDEPDYVHFNFDLDNSGSFSNLLWIENDGALTNSAPYIDTDFDGIGDGAEITNTFTQFTESITGMGLVLDIEIEFNLDAADEDIAIDNIEIWGVPTVIQDWCNIQWPIASPQDISLGDSFTVYAQVFEGGFTDTNSSYAPGINAWIGYSLFDNDPSDPANAGDWTWVAASPNPSFDFSGNNDEYLVDIGTQITSGGTYYYASRFQLNSGTYIYGGTGGLWNNDSVELKVSVPDFYNLQYPENGIRTVGDPFLAFAQIYEPGVTNLPTPDEQGPNIQAWIGYSLFDNDPSDPANAGDWTWVVANYNSSCSSCDPYNSGSDQNDEYFVDIGSSLPVGTYYYASRFTLDDPNVYYYGGFSNYNGAITGGEWGTVNGSEINRNGILTINPPCSDLFISEYVEGSSNNKYIELYNPTDSSIDLSSYQLVQYNNGDSNVTYTLSLSGSIGAYSTYVIANENANLYGTPDLSSNSSVMNFNGDDVIALQTSGGVNIDVFGQIGNDPGTNWPGACGTADKTLVRNFSVDSGDYDGTDAFNTDSEWTCYAIDDVSNLGTHSSTCSSCTPTHTVTSFSPTSGPVDTIVTITGTGFTSSTMVTFYNGINATIISQTATELVVEVPDGALTGPITIEEDGCSIDTADFTLIDSSGTCANLVDLIMTEIYDNNGGTLGYIEVYNGTGSTIDLSNYSIRRYGDATDLSNGEYTLYEFPSTMSTITNNTVIFGSVFSNPADNDGTATQDFDYDIDCSNTGGNWNCGGINEEDIFHLYNGLTLIDVYIVPNATIGYVARRNTNTSGPNNVSNPSDWTYNDTESISNLGEFNFTGSSSSFPTVNTSPSDINCSNDAVFTTLATPGNSGTLSYEWYFNDGSSSGWTLVNPTNLPLATVSGEDTFQLTLSGNYYGYSGYQFYCLVTEDGSCSQASDAAQLDFVATTWNGSSWSNDVPDINTIAIIDANYTTTSLHGSFSACQLLVNSSYTLNVDNNYFVEVEHDVINSGTILVQTSGSFVQNGIGSNAGSFTNNAGAVSSVIKSTSTFNSNFGNVFYTYWSTPVTNPGNLEAVFPNAFGNRRFWYNASNFIDSEIETNNNNATTAGQDDIDDNGDDWQWANGLQMETGKGYAVTAALPPTPGSFNDSATFYGSLNTGDITIDIYKNNNEINDNNWNFIGNPYPSAISAQKFIDANSNIADPTNSGMGGALYFWSQISVPLATNNGNEQVNFSQSDYVIMNGVGGVAGGATTSPPSPYIPSGQGFFVSHEENLSSPTNSVTSTSILFTNDMREKDNNTQFFRLNATESINRLWLNLTSDNGVFSQICVAYTNNATHGYDGLYFDAPRNFSTQTFASSYTLIDSNISKYAIQGRDLSLLDSNEVVPVGFYSVIEVPTIFTFSLSDFEGPFFNNNDIYIKDGYLNIIHDLTESDYNFTSEPGEFNDRFEIVFQTTTLSTDETLLSANDLTIIELHDGSVKFKVDKNHTVAQVEIIDLLGRTLYTLKGNSSEAIYFLPQLSQSAYIAKVTLDNGQTLSKKAIKKH